MLAFTALPLTIAGVLVHQMTGRHFNAMALDENPFIVGGEPSEADAALVLKAVSVSGNLLTLDRNADLLTEVRTYIGASFVDLPCLGGATEDKEPVVATMAWNVHIVASAYGWDDERILDKPLARIYQYVRLIALEKNPKLRFSSPRVRAAWSRYNQWRSQQPKLVVVTKKKKRRR